MKSPPKHFSKVHASERRIGLARALSKMGYCSRSQAAESIRAGKVSLNGIVRRDPETPVRLGKDRVEVNGEKLGAAARIYFAMNKPRGMVTTASDEKGRDTVYSLLPEDSQWVAPVGRLDKGSEGLLLLTNDSEWAARISDPETHLDKTYHVQIASTAEEELCRELSAGVKTTGGETLRAKSVRLLREGAKNSWLEMVLDEGKNRQIRRMLEARGIEVLRLIRVAIGPLQLGEAAKGSVRALTQNEKRALDAAMRHRERPETLESRN